MVAVLRDRYKVSDTTARADITAARDRGYNRQDRERMQAGVVEAIRHVFTTALERTRQVKCGACGDERAVQVNPNVDAALRALYQLVSTLKLDVAAEELLGDDALVEQVAAGTLEHLDKWPVTRLVELVERANALIAVAGDEHGCQPFMQ